MNITDNEVDNWAANKVRRKAITRFALDFLKANLEALEGDDMLEAFGGKITEDEIEALKQHLGVQFS